MTAKIRKTIPRAELNDWLTEKIRKIEDCGDVTLTAKYLLAEPDENGCNWSGFNVTNGVDIAAELTYPKAVEIVRKASALLNLAAE